MISPHVQVSGEIPALGLLAAAAPRTSRARGDYALLVEAIREGYLLHYGRPRVVVGADQDLALLAGDYLYALGLRRLATLGDLEAVRELSDLISLSAQVHAGAPQESADNGAWSSPPGAVARLGHRGRRGAQPGARAGQGGAAQRRTRTPRPRCSPTPRPAPAGRDPGGSWPHGRLDRLGFLVPSRPWLNSATLADGADKPVNGPAPDGDDALPAHDPAGYFEGESMTRRKAFTVMAAGLGGAAGAVIVLPAVGFALAPVFDAGARAVGGRGPARRLRPRDVHAARDHDRRGDRRGRQDDRLRAPGNPGLHRAGPRACPRRAPTSTSRSRPAAPTSAARCASYRRRATSSAPATAASTTSRARSSAARRCARSTASRPASQTARSRSARATASPPSSSRCATATPASSPAASGSTSIRRVRPSRRRRMRPAR